MQDLTRCVVPPAVSHEGFASLAVPTYRASTIVFKDARSYAERGKRGPDGYTYGLHGTPTTRTLEAQITELHGGARTILVPSGQAAISLVFLTFLKPGEKVLIPSNVYGPVKNLCLEYLKPRGIEHAIYDPMIGGGIERLIDATTRLVWIESPGSNTMEVQDVPAIVAAAKRKGCLVGCDNTWAGPLLYKPLQHGVDFVAEALTKYVGGHSDILLGSITVADLDLRARLKDTLRVTGIGVSPDEAALALRGIQTMGVRLAHTGRVSIDLAQKLGALPEVECVLHPALPGSPGHELWKRDFKGSGAVFGAVAKFGLDDRLDAAVDALKVISIGASWGGTRSLIAPMTVEVGGASRLVIRICVGLEDPGDLWADLSAFFAALGRRG